VGLGLAPPPTAPGIELLHPIHPVESTRACSDYPCEFRPDRSKPPIQSVKFRRHDAQVRANECAFAKFGLPVLSEIKNRGTNDARIAVCDGLKGLPQAVSTVWDRAIIQTCVIRLLRTTFRHQSRKYWIYHRPSHFAPCQAQASMGRGGSCSAMNRALRSQARPRGGPVHACATACRRRRHAIRSRSAYSGRHRGP
jgi:hypothetical protein